MLRKIVSCLDMPKEGETQSQGKCKDRGVLGGRMETGGQREQWGAGSEGAHKSMLSLIRILYA